MQAQHVAIASLVEVTFSSSLQPTYTRQSLISNIDRDYRRSSRNKSLPDAIISVFQGLHTPVAGSSRRHRGYQPEEVNKKQPKLGLEDSSTIKDGTTVTDLIVIKSHSKAPATNNKLPSTTTPRSMEPPAPHRRTQTKDQKSNHQPIIHTQGATMDASRPEFDLVHFDGVSELVESEASSMQIITERKPSCWSIASPPEAQPTEWNSAAANIDRPVTAKLPIYRVPKPEPKAERDVALSSFDQQQAKLKPQAAASTPKAQMHKMKGSPQLVGRGNDGAQADSRFASQRDGHAADSLRHDFQQLQHDEQLDAEQASLVKTMQDEVLSKTLQASPGVQLESENLKNSSPTANIAQARLLDSIASSAAPSQAKTEKMSASAGKQQCVVPPHLRVQLARPGPDNKNESLLGTTADLSTTAATKTTARDGNLKRGRHTISAMQFHKLPPHLQGPSGTKTRATKTLIPVTTSSPTSQKNDDSYRPTIDMDEEIATTQSVLEIDEEIVAGVRAETSGVLPEAQTANSNAQGTNEQTVYISPHNRTPFSKSKPYPAESKSKVNDKETRSPLDQHGDRDHSTNTRSNGFTAGPCTGNPRSITSKQKIANLASPSTNSAIPDGAESSVRKGKKPALEVRSVDFASDLVGWDGKMNQPPVGDEWDRRRPFNPQSNERLSVIEAWRKEHAADAEERNRVAVNTASAEFQTGEGLAGGDVNVLSPIDRRDHETRASNDDFTQARRHQSAAEAIKEYEAKMAAKPKSIPPGIEGMTREERRSLRRALIEEERTNRALPNPHAPAANIYLRPAEFKDMGQITTIDNYYVRETSFVLHLDTVDELYW